MTSRNASLVALRPLIGDTVVLVVDDHPVSLQVLTALLKRACITVAQAATGAEAVSLASSIRPALVLLDLRLPDIDGYEVARRIHALPGLERLPLIATSSAASDHDRDASRAAGMAGHLAKPVDPEALYSMLQLPLAVRRSTGVPSARAGGAKRPGAPDPIADPPPGIEIAQGLRFFGDDRTTYRRALERFAEIYERGPDHAGIELEPGADRTPGDSQCAARPRRRLCGDRRHGAVDPGGRNAASPRASGWHGRRR